MKSILSTSYASVFACLFTFAPILAQAETITVAQGQTQPTVNFWGEPQTVDMMAVLKKQDPEKAKALTQKAIEELKQKYDFKITPYSPTKPAFNLKAVKASQKMLQGGGGGVDGGGGNLATQNGELLDRYQYSDLTKIEVEELTTTINKYYETRIQNFETEIPGFKNWLLFGFEKPWFLDSKTFDKTQCPAAQLNSCQTVDAVRLNAADFKKASDIKQADIVITELFRRALLDLPNEKQNKLLGELKKKFSDPKTTSKQFYDFLVKAELLSSPETTERIRSETVANYETQLVKLRQTLHGFLSACQQTPMNFSKSFYRAVGQYMDYTKKCTEWLRPEVDGNACNLDAIAENIVAFTLSNCAKP